MGIVKQLMMEYEQHEWEDAPVTFTCPACGKLSDGEAELPVIFDGHAYELSIGVEIQCIWCDTKFDGEFQKSATECKVIFDEYPDTKVDCDPVCIKNEFDDDWFNEPYFYDRPDSPFSLFEKAYSELKTDVETHAVKGGDSSMNRMFFTQSFSMFEAYLCDAFLNLVFLNVEHQNIFIQKYKDTKELSLSLEDLMRHRNEVTSEVIKKKLTQIIKKNIFHNMEKVSTLFKMYDVAFLPAEVDKEFLFKSVEYRHHAVHRNGHDLEGNKLEVFTKIYISEVVSMMMTIAKNLDKNISIKGAGVN